MSKRLSGNRIYYNEMLLKKIRFFTAFSIMKALSYSILQAFKKSERYKH